MVKSVEEQKAESERIEAQAREYKRSPAYLEAVAAKRAKRGKAPLPAPIKGDVYGPSGQITERLIKQYEAGEIPADVSAEIVETPEGRKVYFSETLHGPSVIKYQEIQEIEKTTPMPEGTVQYTYDLGKVDYPEQVRDIEAWAAGRGARVRRIPGEAGEPGIDIRIESPTPIPEDEEITYRSEETIREERIERSAPTGERIYGEATPLEKVAIHVRTLLSPAGYEYVGAALREELGDSVIKTAIDIVFPDIKSTEQVVKEDITARTKRAAAGKTTYQIMGVDVDERIVSAIHNPVVDIGFMALGGAGIGKVAMTKLGARILTSTAGKAAGIALTGAYAAERTYKVASLRAAGEHTEALGVGATAIAGLAAGMIAYKAEVSHIIRARAEKTIEFRISEVKGVSVSKQVGRKVTVSRGKFKITEGELKGLKGETGAVTGKKGGVVRTYIPEQKLGKMKIERQITDTLVKSGTLSKRLKIYWRKGSDIMLAVGEKVKLLGPRKETTLSQEIAKATGRIGTTDVTVRKFSAVSAEKTARQYDLYLAQRGDKVLLAEQSIIGRKDLAKVDWVDIQVAPTPEGIGPTRIGPGGKISPAPGTDVVTAAPPPTPTGIVKIKPAPPVVSIKPIVLAGPSGSLRPVETKMEIKQVTVPVVDIKVGTTRETRRGTRTVPVSRQKLVEIPVVGERGKVHADFKTDVIPIPVTSFKEVQIQTTRERTAVITELAPILDTLPSPPVPAIPTPSGIKAPKPVIAFPGIVPYLRWKPASALKKFNIGVIRNPVPDIEKLM